MLAADPPRPGPVAALSSRGAVLNSWRFWLAAVVTVLALLVVPAILLAAFPGKPAGGIAAWLLPLLAIAAALVLLGVGRVRDVASGLLAGVAFLAALAVVLALIGFILVAIVLGICIVAFGRQGIP